MKKTLFLFALLGAASVGYSQGLVSTLNNATTYLVSTNGTTVGKTFGSAVDTGGQSYDYVLLYSSTTEPAVAAGSSANVVSDWSVGPTETSGSGPGTIAGSANAQLGAAGTTYFIELVGWSTGLGTSFSSILPYLESDSFTSPGQFLGFSSIGQVTTATAPASGATIFSPTGIPSGFDLNPVPSPEPTTLALSALGGLSLLAFRRKKA
jgi:hypothetical protein